MINRPAQASDALRTVGLIDIGTSKVVCLIAVIDTRQRGPDGLAAAQVIGAGYHQSRGVKAGVVADLDEAGNAVRGAILAAERQAGIAIEEAIVSVSCGRLKSQSFSARANLELGIVTDADLERLIEGGRSYAERGHRTLLHLNELGYRLDGQAGIINPRGMAGSQLVADLHAVSADAAPIRNMIAMFDRSDLATRGLVATPLASALAATSEEERRLGVTLIDIGAGVASIAAFADGSLLYTDAVTVGGQLVTCDIGRALQTPLSEAERIKTLYGTLTLAQSDSHGTIAYQVAGDEPGIVHHTTRAKLAEIMRPRIDSMLMLLNERLEKSGVASFCGDRVVLAGGACQMMGFGEYAATALGRPTRVARLAGWPALPGGGTAPEFAAVTGLLIAARGGAGMASRLVREETGGAPRRYLGRVGEWLRQGF